MAEQGIAIDSDALETVVAESQQYPYFIQAWGQALCQAMVASHRYHVDTGTVAAAGRGAFEQTRSAYYASRYREMEEQALVPAAVLVAKAFEMAESSGDTALQERVAGALSVEPGAAKEMINHLADLGYLCATRHRCCGSRGFPA